MPVQFGDFSKSITDLFDRSGFTADKKIKQTFKTPEVMGCPITVSQELTGLDDFSKGYSSKLSAKWKHACGFSVDKFDNSLAKGTVLETSYNKLPVDGMSVACNMKNAKGKCVFPLEVTYENDVIAGSLATQAPDFKDITANMTLASEGLMVGSSMTFKGGAAAPSDFPISLSYSGNGVAAVVEATDELKTFTLLGSYKASPKLKLAAKFLVPDGEKRKMSLVGVYNLGGDYNTKVAGMFSQASGFKGKDNKAATLECAVVAKPLAKVETGCALAFPLAKPEDFKYGLTFTLG